jgi:hypothetical protein
MSQMRQGRAPDFSETAPKRTSIMPKKHEIRSEPRKELQKSLNLLSAKEVARQKDG